jgi:hypothetical protein
MLTLGADRFDDGYLRGKRRGGGEWAPTRAGTDRHSVLIATAGGGGTTFPAWAPGRDNDELPVTGAHREETGVSLLQNARNVGDHLGATSCGPAPPDHNPLADIGGC